MKESRKLSTTEKHPAKRNKIESETKSPEETLINEGIKKRFIEFLTIEKGVRYPLALFGFK